MIATRPVGDLSPYGTTMYSWTHTVSFPVDVMSVINIDNRPVAVATIPTAITLNKAFC